MKAAQIFPQAVPVIGLNPLGGMVGNFHGDYSEGEDMTNILNNDNKLNEGGMDNGKIKN